MRYTVIGLAALVMTACGGDGDPGPGFEPEPMPNELRYEISGTVLEEGRAGTPIPRARVTMRTPSFKGSGSALTDENGEFLLTFTIFPDDDCTWYGPKGKSDLDYRATCSFTVTANGYETYRHDSWPVLCLIHRGRFEIPHGQIRLEPKP